MLENAKRQFFLVLLAVLAGLACIATLKIPLGSDLKGGTQLLYEVPADVLEELVKKENASVDAIMTQTVAVIHERIDPTGTLDPLITRSGDTGILIELGHFEDPQDLKRVLERISNLGKLEMRIVADGDFRKENVSFNMQAERQRLENWLKDPANMAAIKEDPREIRRFNRTIGVGPIAYPHLEWYPRLIGPSRDRNRDGMWDGSYTSYPTLSGSTVKAFSDAEWNNGVIPDAVKQKPVKDQYLIEFIALNMKERFFTGENLDPSGVGVGTGSRGIGVNYAITPDLAPEYYSWSDEYTGKASAIVLNGIVKSAPTFNSAIGGHGIIEGNFTREEVDELVKVLRTGSLRVEPELMSQQTIGAQLGEAAIMRGVISILAGGVLVFVFVLFYYGFAGTIACITLLLNVYLLYAAMLFLQATITLPGLGGIVLTLGMAVDANVLIYERIREELQKGKEMLQAVRAGFERAMSAILDSNITTFLVGIVLFQVGVGPVRGFAVTLMVGIVTTVFTQFFVTRLLFHWALENKKLEGWKPRTLLENRSVDFVGKIKMCVVASGILIVAGLAYMMQVPNDVMLGIDFTGGANLHMVLREETGAEVIRARLKGDPQFAAAYPNATVTKYGDEGREFNVRLKLDDTQREAIAQGRRDWRENRIAAEKAGEQPPAPFEPPYVAELKRVFADALVKPAFSDQLLTPQARDPQNLAWAQIDVHFARPVKVATVQEHLQKSLAGSSVSAVDGPEVTEARDLRIEWSTQASTKAWELAGFVQEQLKELKDGNDKRIVLSDPFPEAQEIQGRLVDALRNAAIGALVLAWALIVLYLRVRFHEYKYGLAAVVALIHDVLVTFVFVVAFNNLGIVHAEISLSMIAAFLTIIGYSVNDTIVVFDRIRENRIDNARNGVDEPFRALINRSLNQTLSRTVLTTVLTLFVVLAQFAVNWGSESDLESFAFAMIIGMVSGVYSTMFIAAPILIWMDKGEAPIIPERPVDIHATEVVEQEA